MAVLGSQVRQTALAASVVLSSWSCGWYPVGLSHDGCLMTGYLLQTLSNLSLGSSCATSGHAFPDMQPVFCKIFCRSCHGS